MFNVKNTDGFLELDLGKKYAVEDGGIQHHKKLIQVTLTPKSCVFRSDIPLMLPNKTDYNKGGEILLYYGKSSNFSHDIGQSGIVLL